MRLPLPALALLSLAATLGACRSTRVCCAIQPFDTEQTIYVVRHAERLDATDDPPLSAAGEARARALGDSLARWGAPDVAFATRFVRAHQTATGALPSIAPQRYDHTSDAAADARTLAATLRTVYRTRTPAPILVVGHSNTVPVLLTALDGRPRPDLAHGDYDGVYVVRLRRRWRKGVRNFEPIKTQVTVTRRRVGADDGVADPE